MKLTAFVDDPTSFRSKSWATRTNEQLHGLIRVIAQDTFRGATFTDDVIVSVNDDILEHARGCHRVRLLVSLHENADGINVRAELRTKPGVFMRATFSDTELAAGEVIRWFKQCMEGSVTVESTASGAGGHSDVEPAVPTPSFTQQTEFVATEEAELPPEDEEPEVKPRARRKSRKSG
jgi:hypothetical protein